MEIIREHGTTKNKAALLARSFLDALMKRNFLEGLEFKGLDEKKSGDLITFIFKTSEEKKILPKAKKPKFLFSFFSWLRGRPVIYGVVAVYQERIRFLFQVSGFENDEVLQKEIAGVFEEFFPEKGEKSLLKTEELGSGKRRRQ
jgi:hypothetical protein